MVTPMSAAPSKASRRVPIDSLRQALTQEAAGCHLQASRGTQRKRHEGLPTGRAPSPPPSLPAAWIARQTAEGRAPCSPLTGLPLEHLQLSPNQALARRIKALRTATGPSC